MEEFIYTRRRVTPLRRTERYRSWRVDAMSHSEEGSERKGRRKGAKGEEECDHETWC